MSLTASQVVLELSKVRANVDNGIGSCSGNSVTDFSDAEVDEMMNLEGLEFINDIAPPAASYSETPDYLCEDAKRGEDEPVTVIVWTACSTVLQAEAPQAETPQAEASQAEVPQAEVPQAEVPQAEAPQAEASQAEAPQAEVPQAEAPQAEALRDEALQCDMGAQEPVRKRRRFHASPARAWIAALVLRLNIETDGHDLARALDVLVQEATHEKFDGFQTLLELPDSEAVEVIRYIQQSTEGCNITRERLPVLAFLLDFSS